jgi:capsular polysaccharide biosynthesis protein
MRLSLISKEIDRHKQQLAELHKQIGAYQGKVQSVPVLETQLAGLTRNYETSRQNYQSLLDKRLSAGMSEDLERKQQAERFTVLDIASTPEKPFAPKRLPLMAGAVLVAILLSCGVCIGSSFLKGAIRSEVDLVSVLGPKLKILGTVPPIIAKGDEKHTRMLNIQLALFSALACVLLVVFFLKVRPIL